MIRIGAPRATMPPPKQSETDPTEEIVKETAEAGDPHPQDARQHVPDAGGDGRAGTDVSPRPKPGAHVSSHY
jgi:hypothetical protein